MKKILIIGANSAIAEHYARLEAAHGSKLALTGRSGSKLAALCQDLTVRGSVGVHPIVMDANSFDDHSRMFEVAHMFLGNVDVILIAHGVLPDQDACLAESHLLQTVFETNATSTILLMSLGAAMLRKQGHGTIAVISSVAGDRGRGSNFVYGSAKSAVSSFASGLGQLLAREGINVVTIKPGFVETPMTEAFRKGPLWSKPDYVAKKIQRAIDIQRNVAYVPWFWWPIMRVITHIPESIFRRIRL